jgi:hypothetical protein
VVAAPKSHTLHRGPDAADDKPQPGASQGSFEMAKAPEGALFVFALRRSGAANIIARYRLSESVQLKNRQPHQWALTLGSDHRTPAPTGGIGAMAEQPRQSGLSAEALAALARETGASEQQIQEIASLIGNDRASILREARMVAGERSKR